MYGKECVLNVDKNKNKENLNLTIWGCGERFGPKNGQVHITAAAENYFLPSPYFK
jgi:hypothetical protein